MSIYIVYLWEVFEQEDFNADAEIPFYVPASSLQTATSVKSLHFNARNHLVKYDNLLVPTFKYLNYSLLFTF